MKVSLAQINAIEALDNLIAFAELQGVEPSITIEGIRKARAAVAELIEALQGIADNGGSRWDYATIGNVARAALARVQGGAK